MQVLPPVQARRQCRAVSTPLSVIATACLVFSHSSFAQQVIANGVHVQIDDGRSIDTGSTVGRAGVAVLAQDGGSVNILDTGGAVAIATHGGNGHGLVAERGGIITMRGGGINAEQGMGLFANDAGSRIDLDNVQVFAGQTHEGVRADDGARIGVTGGTVTAEAGHGVMAFAGGARIDVRGTTINTSGDNVSAVEANSEATVTITGGVINTSGQRGYGLEAIGLSNGTLVEATGTRIRTTGRGAHGAHAMSGAIRAEQADIVTTGQGAAGIWVEGFNDQHGYISRVDVLGGSVQTQGAHAHGLGALSGGQLLVSDVDVTTRGMRAAGTFAMHGAHVALAGGAVTTEGAEAYGLVAMGQHPVKARHTTLATHGVDITTHGAGAHGVVLAGAADLHLLHGPVTTHGAGAAALVATPYGQGTGTALVSDAQLVAHQGAGILVEGTTLDATLRRASVSGGTRAIDLMNGTAGAPATLNLALESSTLDGASHLETGSTFNLSVDAQSTWNTRGDAVVSSLANGGTVNLVTGTTPGHTLTVTRDFTGTGGTVRLATQMGGDASATDKIVLDGARASGDTSLLIQHAGGEGAQTVQGIRLVQTRNGGATDATAFRLNPGSDGYRQGVGSIAAGAYDYQLVRGGEGGQAEDWYLVANVRSDGRPDDVTPLPPLRPEVGAYLSNKLAASTLLFHTLRDRQGERTAAASTGDANRAGRHAWLRTVGTTASRNGALGLTGSDNRYLVHAGSDVFSWPVGKGSIHVGAMGAYGGSRNASRNGPLAAHGKVDGVSGGIYGTWYGNRHTETGPYVDTWVMYGAYDNEVNGAGLPSERYRSSNLVTSIETGHAFPLHRSADVRTYLEPQLQILYANYWADRHVEQGGTVVSQLSESSVTTRLGLRLHGDVSHPETAGSPIGVMRLLPFAEINWWHGPATQTAQFDSLVVREELPANRLEARVGMQGDITRRLTVWGSVGFEAGAQDYTVGKAQLGMRYRW
ncbi:autotransporter outer membrane beta-barrel domain-containing protein [Cupriavidus sp. 2KB_3]|uniref:autotransporter family protein n=1 Tax=Cupriavidus sp. 2KB_3 TaxID=3232980 RepID=UPI003F93665A